MDPSSSSGPEGQFPQYQNSNEQQYRLQEAQHQYQQQQAQQQHDLQQQNQLQQQQILQQQQQLEQQQQRQRETINFETVMTMMAESQNRLMEGMTKLLTKFETLTPQTTLDPKIERHHPPHINPIPSMSYS